MNPTSAPFQVCLTHDVDRLSKTYQGLYYALTDRDPGHLRSYVSTANPYWQFDTVTRLEDDLGVRSSFYFLNEQRLWEARSPCEWLSPEHWKLFVGRYDVTDERVVDVIRRLDRGGWEIGLHGSYDSYADFERLREEKETLESILGAPVRGGRQHYVNLERPQTWEYHRDLGLVYDTSVGSSSAYGLELGQPFRPFDDEFVVFPTTIMDVALMNAHDSVAGAWEACREILREARERGAVVTVCWHPRVFYEREYPGYATVYKRLIQTAKEMGAWIGPVSEAYDALEITH